MKLVNRIIWGETFTVSEKPLSVKEWFAAKVFNRGVFDTRVMSIVGETEKAFKIILGTPWRNLICWAPKSVIVESVDYSENNDLTVVGDYATAIKYANLIKDMII